MDSFMLDYRHGHDIYRISVTVVLDATLGHRLYRPELVIEKNLSDLDAEVTRRFPISKLFESHDKAQRFAVGYAKKLIEGDLAIAD
jgi:hypothetical protein